MSFKSKGIYKKPRFNQKTRAGQIGHKEFTEEFVLFDEDSNILGHFTENKRITKGKTRTLLFKNIARLGESDQKTLDYTHDWNTLDYQPNQKQIGNFTGILSSTGKSGQNYIVDDIGWVDAQNDDLARVPNAADRKALKRMQWFLSENSVRQELIKNLAENSARMATVHKDPGLKTILDQLADVDWVVHAFESPQFAQRTPGAVASANWYKTHGYTILDVQDEINFSAPYLEVYNEYPNLQQSSKFFLPCIVAHEGVAAKVTLQKVRPKTEVDRAQVTLEEFLSMEDKSKSGLPPRTQADIFGPKYAKMRAQLADSCHITLPYYGNYTQRAKTLVTYKQLDKFAKQNKIDFDPNKDFKPYEDYRKAVADEAKVLDSKGNTSHWSFRGRTLYGPQFKKTIYVALPNLKNLGAGRYMQNIAVRRKTTWWKNGSSLLTNSIKLQKQGYARLGNYMDGAEFATALERFKPNPNLGHEMDKTTIKLVAKMHGGSTLFPKINRYNRTNILFSLEYKQLETIIANDLSIRFGLQFFGIFDIDSENCRFFLESSASQTSLFNRVQQIYGISSRALKDMGAEERAGVMRMQTAIFPKFLYYKASKRLTTWYKSLGMANKVIKNDRQIEQWLKDGTPPVYTSAMRQSLLPLTQDVMWVMAVCCSTSITDADRYKSYYDVEYKGLGIDMLTQLQVKLNQSFRATYKLAQNQTSGLHFAYAVINMIVNWTKSEPPESDYFVRAAKDDEVNPFNLLKAWGVITTSEESAKYAALTPQQRGTLASLCGYLIELQETIIVLTISYQQTDYKGINDSQALAWLLSFQHQYTWIARICGKYFVGAIHDPESMYDMKSGSIGKILVTTSGAMLAQDQRTLQKVEQLSLVMQLKDLGSNSLHHLRKIRGNTSTTFNLPFKSASKFFTVIDPVNNFESGTKSAKILEKEQEIFNAIESIYKNPRTYKEEWALWILLVQGEASMEKRSIQDAVGDTSRRATRQTSLAEDIKLAFQTDTFQPQALPRNPNQEERYAMERQLRSQQSENSRIRQLVRQIAAETNTARKANLQEQLNRMSDVVRQPRPQTRQQTAQNVTVIPQQEDDNIMRFEDDPIDEGDAGAYDDDYGEEQPPQIPSGTGRPPAANQSGYI